MYKGCVHALFDRTHDVTFVENVGSLLLLCYNRGNSPVLKELRLIYEYIIPIQSTRHHGRWCWRCPSFRFCGCCSIVFIAGCPRFTTQVCTLTGTNWHRYTYVLHVCNIWVVFVFHYSTDGRCTSSLARSGGRQDRPYSGRPPLVARTPDTTDAVRYTNGGYSEYVGVRVLTIPSTLRLSTCSTPSVRVNTSSYRDARFMVRIYDAAIRYPFLIRKVYNAIPCHRTNTISTTYLRIHPGKQEMIPGTEIIHKKINLSRKQNHIQRNQTPKTKDTTSWL